jgi:small membrane protein
MEITIIQILIVLFVIFAWSRVFLRMRDKDIGLGEFILWSIIWVTILIITIFPVTINFLSGIVGIGRGIDLAVYTSIILLFYLMFRLYVKADSQNRELTKVVRELAIKNVKKKK